MDYKQTVINGLGKSFSELDSDFQHLIEVRLDEEYYEDDKIYDCKVEGDNVYALVKVWDDPYEEEDSMGYILSGGERLDLGESGVTYSHDDLVMDWDFSHKDELVWVNVKEL